MNVFAANHILMIRVNGFGADAFCFFILSFFVEYIVACVTFFFSIYCDVCTKEKMVACKWVYFEVNDKLGNIDNNIIL